MTTSQTTRAAFDFDLLIAPIEPAHFFAEFWEKRPLVISRQSPIITQACARWPTSTGSCPRPTCATQRSVW
jgi:hypothetical protein